MKKIRPIFCITLLLFCHYTLASPLKKNTSHQKYTKPHAGIELDYKYPKAIQPGDSLELELNFKTRLAAESLQINIKHDKGLQLDSNAHYQLTVIENETNTVTLQITGLLEGRFFIDINAIINHNGTRQARSFSIPVTVGDPRNFKTSAGTDANSGYTARRSEGVMSMPATETIE